MSFPSRALKARWFVSLCLAGLGYQAAAASEAPARAEFLNSPEVEQRDLPFSEAARAGGFIFLAGQLGLDSGTGTLVPGGIEPETRQALSHVKHILEQNGASLADVVKCTIYLADIGEWAKFNSIYKEFFRKPFPVRTAFGGNDLAFGARVEVECLAYAPDAVSARSAR